MIVKRAHHVSFGVSDLERARAFYGDLLGLEEIERPDFGIPGAWFQAGDAQVHLIAQPEGFAGGTPPPALNPLADHAAFEIDDYEKVLSELRTRGIEVLATSPRVGQMWIRDPDGHIIELIRPGPV
ncbi:MAG: VOC family protein [Candidatus Rokuibacteriota bacterium]